jgi:hypothetical protein
MICPLSLMPSTKVHALDAKLRGYNNVVNEVIDLPFLWLGRNHRILFHTIEEATFIGYMLDGPRGAAGGGGHVLIDGAASGNRVLRAFMEMAAGRKRRGGLRVRLPQEEDVVTFKSTVANACRESSS